MPDSITQRNQNILRAAEKSAFASAIISISVGDPLELVGKKALIGAGCTALSSLFLAPIAETMFPESTLMQNGTLLAANYFLKKEVEKITEINSSTKSHTIANIVQLVFLLESKNFFTIY